MKRLVKKLITTAFVVAMMMGMMTISAFAEGEGDSEPYSTVTVTVKWNKAEKEGVNNTIYFWCWGESLNYTESKCWPGDPMKKIGYATWRITIPIMEQEETVGFIPSFDTFFQTTDLIIPSSGNVLVTVSEEIEEIDLGYKKYLATIEVLSDDVEEPVWEYEISDDNSVIIKGYLGNDTEIVIPAEIGGCAVKSIADGAFKDCISLTSIEIPSGVTSINLSAFSGCTSLEKIEVDKDNMYYSSIDGILYNKEQTELHICPSGIKSDNVIVPDGVVTISDGAFFGCEKICSIKIPSSVTYFGYMNMGFCALFDGCKNLESIEVDENNPNFTSQDGILYSKDLSTLIRCPEKREKDVIVPNSVITIKPYAFYGCENIRRIEIPDGITEIVRKLIYGKGGEGLRPIPKTAVGAYAFDGCKNLSFIIIPASVIYIADEVFDDCPLLTIYGYADSYAKAYAKVNSIPYKVIEKAGWKQNATGWWYDNGDGTYPKSTWKSIDGSWYYFDGNGYMVTGWLKEGRNWYYLESNCKMATGWKGISGKWYFFESNGKMAANKWVDTNYYVKSDGVMATDEWVDGGRYYVDANGKWVPNKTKAGWKQNAAGWWYDNGDSTYPTSTWKSIDGSWYYFNASGYIVTGWFADGGSWYYFDSNGKMATGWKLVDGNWYYLESNGKMASSKWIDGTYYVKANGVMAVSEWVDEGRYYVDSYGKWVSNKAA